MIRMPARPSTRREPPPAAHRFGLWTREPRAGAKLHMPGYAAEHIELDKNRAKRADQLLAFVDPDRKLSKETRDLIAASVADGGDDGLDPLVKKYMLSNERVDSYNSTLAWDGWKLVDYRSNPVVLLSHDSNVDRSLPIGKDIGAFMDPTRKALVGLARFASQELAGAGSLEARAIRWIKAGLMRAVSVGFEPIKWEVAEARDDGESWIVPMDFKEQELKEYSPTPVPSNPDALADGRGWGDLSPEDVDAFSEDIERSLDGAGWLALPRATLEQMRAAIRGAKIRVEVGGSAYDVTRADGATDGTGDGEGGVEDPQEELCCPACGYQGPESGFTMNPGATVTMSAPEAEQAAAAVLSTEALAGELRKRHAKAGAHAHVDSPTRAGNADAVVRTAGLVASALDALDAQGNGRLPT